jgi:Proteasome assembly chaperone 4
MISVDTRHLVSADPSLPALALQVTRFVDSHMVWIGTTECSPADIANACSQGSLCKDWACAMPPKTVGHILIKRRGTETDARLKAGTTHAPATSLSRSSSSDVALSMAQRLGKIHHLESGIGGNYGFYSKTFQEADIPVVRHPFVVFVDRTGPKATA